MNSDNEGLIIVVICIIIFFGLMNSTSVSKVVENFKEVILVKISDIKDKISQNDQELVDVKRSKAASFGLNI